MYLRLEGLIENGVAGVILNVLPASVAVAEVDLQSRKSAEQAEDDTTTCFLNTHNSLQASLSRICCKRIRDDAGQQPVVVAAVPDIVHLSSRQCGSLLGLPKGVEL